MNLKRLVFLLTFVAIIIGLFLSRKFLFSVQISLIGEPPYQIDRLGSQTEFCLNDPCKIRLPLGDSILVIQKEKHRSIVLPLSLGFFDSQTRSLNFEPLPQLTRVDDYSISETKVKITQTSSGQSLIDSKGKVLANFPHSFKPTTIISNKNYTLINNDQSSYLIDHATKSRTKMNRNLLNIPESAKLSPRGRFIAYSTNNGLRVLGLQAPFHTFDINYPNLPLENGAFVWLSNEKLIFATNNEFESSESQSNGLNAIYFQLGRKSNYLFATYDPQTKNFELINNFPEIEQQPFNLSHSYLENALYFETENSKFRLGL